MTMDLDAQAVGILRDNDRGGYTVPTSGLYPYQWNWDSAFAALGFATFDRDRAWRELEDLISAQWSDGMVPHIIFWQSDPGYFPGPEVWGTKAAPPSSGYSQPPVATTALRWLFESGPQAEGEPRLRALFPQLLRWHRWLHTARDPDRLGIIAIAHPWESGRDNLPDWDLPMAQVDISGVGEYHRRDTAHVEAAMRPQKADYDRYLAIIYFARDHGWDAETIAKQGPFWVADVGMTAILLRADRDLLALAQSLGEPAAAAEISGWIERAEAGFDRLWHPDLQAYCSLDLRTGRRADGITSATMLAFYAGVPLGDRAGLLHGHLERWWHKARYGVPSFDPDHRAFDSIRYWRGPVWPNMNFLIARGLADSGHGDLAARVDGDTRALIETSGFFEYFCSRTGRGCGGTDFSWTAAVWLALGASGDARRSVA